jgi:hypothetical protein
MRQRLHRFFTVGAVLTLIAVPGCSGESTGPGLDTGPLTVADIEGAWTVRVPRTVACLPNRDPFRINLDLQPSGLADFTGAVGEEYFSGNWHVEPEGEAFFVQGWVQMESRTFRFLLWQGTHVKGSVFQGRFLAGGHLSAALVEPIPPGNGWAADPIPGYPGGFAIGTCEWRVEGERAAS